MKLTLQIAWILGTAACIGSLALPGDWVFVGYFILFSLALPSSLVFMFLSGGLIALTHITLSPQGWLFLNYALLVGIGLVGYLQWFVALPFALLGPKRRAAS